jgi:hypothetical protein
MKVSKLNYFVLLVIRMLKHGLKIQSRRLRMSNYDYIPNVEEMTKALEKLTKAKQVADSVQSVDHPPHYNFGEIEAIEVIEDQGLGEAFCAANVIKYIMRYKHKGTPLKDLQKIKWYTERLINYYENSNKK